MRMRVISFLVALLVVGTTTAKAAAPFVLAEDGKAKAVIVVPKNAPAGIHYAATELADFFGRISGSRFMVTDTPVKGFRSVLVGTPYKAEHPEELCVRVKDANTLEVTGDRSRGTLYAAYDLLESMGVIFCARDFDYVPKTNRLEIAGDYHKVDWPFMYAYRGAQCDTGNGDFRFASKLRFQVRQPVADKAGYSDLAEDFDHKKNHAVTLQWVAAHKFRKDHPEWYAYVRPTKTRNFAWVCISNEEMWTQLLKEIDEYLQKNPNIPELSVAIGDTKQYCECEACTATVRKYLDPDGAEVPSIQVYLLANRIGKTFAKKYPKVRFNFLPYGDRQPANPIARLEPNVGGISAELWRNHCLPADCNERSAWSLAQFCRNAEGNKNVPYVWEYMANFRDWMIPYPNLYIIGQSMRYYKRLGVRGLYTQYQYNGLGDLSELKLWLHAKLLWNPDVDCEALVDKYVKANYGPAARYIKEYIDIVEHARLRQRWTWYGCYVWDTSHFLTDEDCVKIYRAFTNAERSAGGAYRTRVRRACLPIISMSIWRYQDMLAPAEKMHVKLLPLKELWSKWHAIVGDSGNQQYSGQFVSEAKANNYRENVTTMFDLDIQPTNRIPKMAVLNVTAKEMTGGSRMTRGRDADGTEYARLKVALAGEPERIWMNPGFAEIGYSCKLEESGDWYVFADVRIGATVDGDPGSAYMGIYQYWYPNGVKRGVRGGGQMEVANQAIIGRLANRDKWQTICLGKRRITMGSRVWVMPGILHATDYIDVRSFTFVHPDLVEKSVAK